MFGFLAKILGLEKRQYEKQKSVLEVGSTEERQKLADADNTHPEVLYYLAKDENPEVRKSVAMNTSTPVHASTLLANDPSDDVRMVLVKRLVELLPDLSAEEHSKLYAYAAQALHVLAEDEVLTIRKALSSSLKDYANAPPKVVGQLARDVEQEVSEPILCFCLALEDDDLLDILSSHPEPWVISAIAGRPVVSDPVANAVIDTQDIPANKKLLQNDGVKFKPSTLQKIIDYARECEELQEDIVMRKDLSYEMAQRIAGFVSRKVLKIMEGRTDFDRETSREVASMVQRRMEFFNQSAPHETPESKVERYAKNGKLNADVVQDALAWNDEEFVLLSVAKLAGLHPIVADKMLKSGTAKSIVALCWKAGIPMRTAIILQKDYAKLKPDEILYAKGGTDFPLEPSEIKWHLEFFGVNLDGEKKSDDTVTYV